MVFHLQAIGDSHTLVFEGQHGVEVNHLGAATAYGLSKDDSKTQARKQVLDLSEQMRFRDAHEIMMLSFGEIDARVHVYNQHRKRNVRMSRVINESIESYAQILNKLRSKPIKFFVMGTPPASTQGNFFEYEHYADAPMRAAISYAYNQKLKGVVESLACPYFDVYEITADADGFIKDEYRRDEVHVNDKIIPHLYKFLFNIGFL